MNAESNEGKDITFSNDVDVELRSRKIGNRFSSCNVTLIIEGVSKDGKLVDGSYSLVHENDKEVCASKEALGKLINSRLVNILNVKYDGLFLKIK